MREEERRTTRAKARRWRSVPALWHGSQDSGGGGDTAGLASPAGLLG